ncbi:MAG: AAA family ATPase [Crocinitomicaceae bacterium]|jgi:predicted ATPase|nr:AAA family ATPase [Crocinitomicaceae bacterium]
MINRIKFKNYKGFKDADIELKPITLLLGANSTGKSSIIQLLLMLTQTINYEKAYKSALRLNGDLVRLGEFENIFANRNTNNPIELEIFLSKLNLYRISRRFKDSIEDVFFSLDKINSMLDQKESIKSTQRTFLRRPRQSKQEDSILYREFLSELPKVKREINKKIKTIEPELVEELFTRYFRTPRNRRSINGIYNKETNQVIIDVKPYLYSYNFLEEIEDKNFDSIKITYKIAFNKKDNNLDVQSIAVKTHSDINILSYEYERVQRGRHHNLSSDFIEAKILKHYKSKFGNHIIFKGLQISRKDLPKNYLDDIFVDTLFEIFHENIKRIDFEFYHDRINYVSPLRAFPKRYYFLDEAVVNNTLNSIDGNQLAEILHENYEIRKQVNNWLEKFKFKVSVSQLKDVIHNIRINQGGLSLDITDVGFGLSQILPIIVQGFLSEENSLTIIEQPEIHLHPKMQAELADLFIDMVRKKNEFDDGKLLLIETHSEYLLKRLRRRIAEGIISSDDVGIYFLHPKDKDNKSNRIEKIEISETGAFDWPSEFYIDDLNDTIEFLKHQK